MDRKRLGQMEFKWKCLVKHLINVGFDSHSKAVLDTEQKIKEIKGKKYLLKRY